MNIETIAVAIFALLVPALACYKKVLSPFASLLALIMVFAAQTVGNRYAVFLLAEFLFISLIDKICKKRIDYADKNIIQKTGTRDVIQVFANGGVALLSVIIWHLSKRSIFLMCFTASLIESFGDSAASSIGIAANKQTFDVLRMKKMDPGLSGGISIPGTFACAISCSMMAILSHLMNISGSIRESCLLMIAAFGGCIFDSILGAAFQRKEKCTRCGIITEKKVHCNTQTLYYSGCKWLTNDVIAPVACHRTALSA